MIHRRAVLAIVALLTLALICAFSDDTLAQSSFDKRITSARETGLASFRLGGSVLTTTGDPDDLSTYKRNTTSYDFTELIRGRSRSWVEDPVTPAFGRNGLLRFVWMHLRMRVVGAF